MIVAAMSLGSIPATSLEEEQALEHNPEKKLLPVASVTLEPFGSGLPKRGQWRNAFAIADINGDGILDLVHGPPRKGRGWPVIFIGDGKGRFARWATASFPRLPFDYGTVAVADFDADGSADDIAIASHLRGLTILAGDGTGTFTESGRGLGLRLPGAGSGSSFSPGALVAIDWNRDGRIDLAGLAEGPSRLALRAGDAAAEYGIRVFLNEVDAWRAVGIDEGDRSLTGRSLAAGDVDGDGRTDLLAGSATLGFTNLLKRNNAGQSDVSSWTALQIPAQAVVTAVALADLDGNGRSDPILAVSAAEGSTWRNTLQVHLSFPGRFETILITPDGQASIFRALATGKVDHDGRVDLAAVDGEGALSVFHAEKPGSFRLVAKESAPSWRAGCAGYDVHLADLDRDGRDEIVASFAGEPTGIGSNARSNSGGGIQAWKVKKVVATAEPRSHPASTPPTRR